MEPNKNPTAPPPDWHSENAAMGPAPPPPYEDVPQIGYAQPGAGQLVQGYGAAPQYGGYGQQPCQGQPYTVQPYPGQAKPGQPYTGQPEPGQQFMGHPYPGQPYPSHPGSIGVQPTVYVAQVPLEPRGPLVHPVQDYLCYSIFTMLCCSCCLPLGIAALIYSITTRENNHIGDRMAAERSSRMAMTLNHVALGIGIGMVVLMIIYSIVIASI